MEREAALGWGVTFGLGRNVGHVQGCKRSHYRLGHRRNSLAAGCGRPRQDDRLAQSKLEGEPLPGLDRSLGPVRLLRTTGPLEQMRTGRIRALKGGLDYAAE